MRGHAEVPWLAEVLVPVLQARYTSGRDVAGVVPLQFEVRSTDGLRPRVILGFGDRTVSFSAAPVQLEAGTWYHIGFAHDAAGAVTAQRQSHQENS